MLKILLKTCITTAAEVVVINVNFMFAVNLNLELLTKKDLRQYGNNIMREIVKELNIAQRVEVDGLNGFSRIKLYQIYNDLTPSMTI